MKTYSTNVTNTPPTQPIFGRTDMVQNNAGGYVFEVTPQDMLERFLLIGSEGGTYYVSEQNLTEANAKNIVKMIKADGLTVVNTVVDVLTNNRAPKVDAAMFVLALAASQGNQDTKNAVYRAIPTVMRTATQLFLFVANIQNLRGWSRGLRKAVAKFYTDRSPEQLAYQLVKYRNRAGFTHRDIIRLAHPATTDEAKNELLSYAVGRLTEDKVKNELVFTFGEAQVSKGKELVELINKGKLTWEMIPTQELNNKDVLTALLPNMPLVALIRNLNRFSYNGMTDGNTATTQAIVAKLTNAELVKKTGMHPVNIINSMMTYSSGQGQRGDKSWAVNQRIVDALHTTYELALKAIVPSGKRILLGVDVSGSMQVAVGGMQLNAAQTANVLALTILKSEPNAELIWFDTKLINPTIGRRSSVDEAIKQSPKGGGTNCGIPLKYAADNLTSYDAVIILTDSETWAGDKHNFDILKSYRKNVNQEVKVIEIALASNPSSTMPSDDKNILRVVGFDASVIQVINKYLE